MEKMDGRSKDILEENIKQMKQLFPEVFTEEKVDIEKLSEVLGEYTEDEDERYNFSWNGKKDAIRISQTPTTGTLRPDKENSKNWDETENVYIEGDNLEVLKLLQKSYHSKIKMIYLDPPYNTGSDFVYEDNYKDNIKNYLEYTGQVDSEGKKSSTNTESSGRYHTDWLNMMYPRLRLARNLLTEDGVIFISIDDNEVHNLRKVCDEIFGEDNFIANFIWQKTYSTKNNNKYVSEDHDYILCFSKNLDSISKFNRLERTKKSNENYKYNDEDGRGIYRLDNITASGQRNYDIKYKNKIYKEPYPSGWRFKKETMYELIEDNRIYLPEDQNKRPQFKRYLKEQKGLISKTILKHNIVGHTDKANRNFYKLMGDKLFDYPKPVNLIKYLIMLVSSKNSIILDFFAGSSTTAHGVMDLNAEDGGNRKHIMVQLPEEIDEKSEAYKAGYKTISEIGRERIRRAGEKIKEDNKDKEGIEDLDIGFKAFKLDNSNIKEWNPEYEGQVDLESLVDNFVDNRTQEDVLYEIILKYGIDLTTPIKEHDIDGKIIYDIGFGTLYICLDDNIDDETVKNIVELNKESGMENSRVVFKDLGFKNDETKLNAKLTLENNGIEEVLSI